MTLATVRVLGWLVLAHGLSHAVLPLRGSLTPAMLIDDWTPVALYAISMVGFVAAGMGLLGLRPLDVAISPLLVLASGLSLVAIVRFADSSLWLGAACDITLLLVGLWRSYGGWPPHPSHGRVWHAAAVATGFVFLGYVGAATILFPWHRTWGSTREELLMPFPGDRVPRNPGIEIQRAVTIDAPPQEVWRCLLQLSQTRAGFYAYDQLDRAFGVHVFGDHVGRTMTTLAPQRAMVLDSGGAFVVLPAAGGTTRFIIRSTIGDPRIPVSASILNFLTLELPHFVRQRQLMLTIKSLAEQSAVPPDSLRTRS